MTRILPLALSMELLAVVALQAAKFDFKQIPEPAVANNQPSVFPAETLAALAELLRDRDRQIRATAAHTVEKMGPDVVPYLLGPLQDPDPSVRELTANVLRLIGPDAHAAIPGSSNGRATIGRTSAMPPRRRFGKPALRIKTPSSRFAICCMTGTGKFARPPHTRSGGCTPRPWRRC